MRSYTWKIQIGPGLPTLKKRIENDYVLNKAEYPRMVTAVQSLLLNYQPNYNSYRNSQSNGVSTQLICAQRGKTGEDEGNGNVKELTPLD